MLKKKSESNRAVAVSILPVSLLLFAASCGGGKKADPPVLDPVEITTEGLPSTSLGFPYSVIFQAAGGTGIYDWSADPATLPDGLILETFTGELSGDTTVAGTFNFMVTVTSGDDVLTQDFMLLVGDLDPASASVIRITLAPDGTTEANGPSGGASLSPDGRFVAFTSFADNLASNLPGGDLNSVPDVFIRDLDCPNTSLVSLAPDGTQGDLASWLPSLSALVPTAAGDVLYVAYVSGATNLVASDTNVLQDVFVTAVRVTGPPSCTMTPLHTTRINVAGDGTETDGTSTAPAISATGEVVVFASAATNLVPTDTNNRDDIFAAALQFTGGFLAAGAPQRISIFVRIRGRNPDIFSENTIGDSSFTLTEGAHIGQKIEILNGPGAGQVRIISGNDPTTFTVSEVWEVLPTSDSAFRVFTASTGSASSPRISADGNIIAFSSAGSFGEGDTIFTAEAVAKVLATDEFLRLSIAGHATPANGASNLLGLNDDGSLALFSSSGNNLVADDTNSVSDLFVRDRINRVTGRVNLADDGGEANDRVGETEGFVRLETADFSTSGRLIVYDSPATNLMSPVMEFSDTRDVFLRDMLAGTTQRLSIGLEGVDARLDSFDAAISLDGSTIVFTSDADNLVTGDTNMFADLFLVTTGVLENPVFLTTDVPSATVGSAYESKLLTVGGAEPLLYSVSGGALPPGVTLDSRTGVLAGLPTEPGRYSFAVTVMDSNNPLRSRAKTFTLVVEE